MIQTVLLVLAAWLVIGSAATYVWVTWRMRCNHLRITEQTRPDWDEAERIIVSALTLPDWDAELRDLIEQHRT